MSLASGRAGDSRAADEAEKEEEEEEEKEGDLLHGWNKQ